MRSLRSRVVAWLGRRYFARTQKKGFNLAKMSFLPDAALMPLKRDGLDPVGELAAKRETEPISRVALPFGMNAWLVSGYEEAKAVLSRGTAFSNDFTNLVGGKTGFAADQNPGGLGMADPPVHTRLRKTLTPEFTMRRLARLTPRIDAIVAGQLDMMAAAHGPVDLATAFALPIPSLTICELLGVPYEDRDDFQRLSTARFDLFGGAAASLGAITESLTYLQDIEIAGTQIAAGDIVVVSLSGANRDSVLGTDMERFDPTRAATSHLAFGYGIHRCIGAELAKMELRAAYPALVRRFPDIRLAVDPAELSFR